VEAFAHRPAKNAARSAAAAWLGVDRSKRSASQMVIPEEIDADEKRCDYAWLTAIAHHARDGFSTIPHADRERALDDAAPGNFFRIIVFDVIRFFDSVSCGACLFESRGLIF
jgi:hypothetical protein